MSKNIYIRIILLATLNILIFIGLAYASIFFEFLVLGWGASANAPEFNIDLTSISQICILGYLAYSKKRIDVAFIGLILLGMYLFLRFELGLN
ncbi:membrane-associated HD superfamily phosphohydrolase [Aureibacter tunicatorum]|uniref:Membrane-associated HD superfamily phosphohydrolase n=1 Tax=Aureibacter tunicatorum TaxID=866807 RepID=A0AAE3XPS9_9BACT|nr:membrane-associated HD superfamily phosphohydrolase [Aureibacter tunicatorum]